LNPVSLLLILLNFAMIGLLPRLHFRQDGRLNGRWWLTAAPLLLSPSILVLHALGIWFPGLSLGSLPAPWDGILCVPFQVLSIAGIAMTIGCHRIPLSLWHQDNDAPRALVTWGPYRRVRHPFYASFLLAMVGAFVFLPDAGTLGALLLAFFILNTTAGKEEARLSASDFGAEYRAYMRNTGRFLPRIPHRSEAP
jgi:protein-S-isoprenylcysteine O-methyltransferase Ste14